MGGQITPPPIGLSMPIEMHHDSGVLGSLWKGDQPDPLLEHDIRSQDIHDLSFDRGFSHLTCSHERVHDERCQCLALFDLCRLLSSSDLTDPEPRVRGRGRAIAKDPGVTYCGPIHHTLHVLRPGAAQQRCKVPVRTRLPTRALWHRAP